MIAIGTPLGEFTNSVSAGVVGGVMLQGVLVVVLAFIGKVKAEHLRVGAGAF